MAAPLLTDYFGAGAKVITDPLDVPVEISPQNPAIVILMSGLSDTGLSVPASMSKPDPLFFSFLKKVFKFSRTDVDEKTFVEVSEPTLNLATRDGKYMEVLDYRLSVFRLRAQSIDFDPDQIDPAYVP